MKRILHLFVLFILLLTGQSVVAVAEEAVEVQEMVFCTGVEDREPVGADTTFLSTVEVVYCFTRLASSVDTTTIAHVWYYNDEEMARVELNVQAKTWRTWSSKRIVQEWTGKWRVDVESESGTVLQSKEFDVK